MFLLLIGRKYTKYHHCLYHIVNCTGWSQKTPSIFIVVVAFLVFFWFSLPYLNKQTNKNKTLRFTQTLISSSQSKEEMWTLFLWWKEIIFFLISGVTCCFLCRTAKWLLGIDALNSPRRTRHQRKVRREHTCQICPWLAIQCRIVCRIWPVIQKYLDCWVCD